jgi:Ion channel
MSATHDHAVFVRTRKDHSVTRDNFRDLQERLRDPLLTALTVMFAILMFVVAPLQAMGVLAAHHFGIVFALLLVVAVFVVSGSPAAVAATLVAVALTVIATLLRLRQPSHLDVYLEATAWLITGLTLIIVVTRAVFAPGRVTFHRIIGAILLYLNIALSFMALFCFVALMAPDAFSGLGPLQDNLALASKLIYFSFVTLTSVGYGDIVPVHPFARSLANIEAIIGQLYPATLLARLVTLEVEGRHGR